MLAYFAQILDAIQGIIAMIGESQIAGSAEIIETIKNVLASIPMPL